ncbi:RNA polymerase sigma factor [Sphingomonas sanguinis]|uniref:RNA polymerase sigma factor n=1 Tax=Sphingomonas sanguinis TaxID=33051 RepID=UPI001C57D642|nr:RNA polymerase sigma factor [Sphingomonas sanguinis]QXT34782.1 RNA polymerase sigma factor [Sphingomonas sanguinis]
MMVLMTEPNLLTAAFLEKRSDLRRYFAARVGGDDADDLVQETYLRIVHSDPKLEIRKPSAYLYQLANNIMLDRLRQSRARGAREGRWHSATVTRTASGEDMDDAIPADRVLISRDRLERLRRALEELPEAVERTFYMHKIEGLSHREVASRLGVSQSLVEKHMMRALRHLMSVPE